MKTIAVTDYTKYRYAKTKRPSSTHGIFFLNSGQICLTIRGAHLQGMLAIIVESLNNVE